MRIKVSKPNSTTLFQGLPKIEKANRIRLGKSASLLKADGITIIIQLFRIEIIEYTDAFYVCLLSGLRANPIFLIEPSFFFYFYTVMKIIL